MATFVHVTDAKRVASILRAGLRAERLRASGRGVHCVPVVPSFQTTFGWLRELKRRGYRSGVAVQFSIPDGELVLIGSYGREPEVMGAAQAVAAFLVLADPRGWEVIILRGITAGEIRRVRPVPQVTGWRYYPDAKGKRPIWPVGEPKARRTRARIEARMQDPWPPLSNDDAQHDG